MPVKKAMKQIIYHLEQNGIGEKQTNYRLRDAILKSVYKEKEKTVTNIHKVGE